MTSETNNVRLDKWLWAVRLFKTRALAAEACRNGRVKINGAAVKPSREVHLDETMQVHVGGVRRVIKALRLIARRAGPAQAKECIEDLTPDSEWERLKQRRSGPAFQRPKGAGRPTKKDRRKLDPFL